MSDVNSRESVAVAKAEQSDQPLSTCRGSGLLCFGITEDGRRFDYKKFLRQILIFKNNGGFNPNSESANGLSSARPPLEEIYMLFCECGESYEGIIRAVPSPNGLKDNNAITSRSGQLWVQAGQEGSGVKCSYSVPVGAIKRGAQIAKGLNETNAEMELYPHGSITVFNRK